MTYSISLLHCMTVSLAEGGAGLGTGWGEQVAWRCCPTQVSALWTFTTPPGIRATRSSSRTRVRQLKFPTDESFREELAPDAQISDRCGHFGATACSRPDHSHSLSTPTL